jgi:hypothetical protein
MFFPSQAFTENDLYLAEAATKAEIPVIAVRNKANLSLQARQRRSDGTNPTTVKEQLINDIRSDLIRNLVTKGLQAVPVYVINSWGYTHNEEEKFEETEFENKLLCYIK